MGSRDAYASTASNLVIYSGIGDGAGLMQASGQKICVGKSLGKIELVYSEGTGDAQSSYSKIVESFDRVVTMDPVKGSPKYIDVLINDQKFRRVRF